MSNSNKKKPEVKMVLVESPVVKNAKKQDPKWLENWKVKIDSEIEAFYGMPESICEKKSKSKKKKKKAAGRQ